MNMGLLLLSLPQHANLHECVEAAGASCRLINSPQSVSMETFLGGEAVVISCMDRDSASVPADQREWREEVQQYLERCIKCLTPFSNATHPTL